MFMASNGGLACFSVLTENIERHWCCVGDSGDSYLWYRPKHISACFPVPGTGCESKNLNPSYSVLYQIQWCLASLGVRTDWLREKTLRERTPVQQHLYTLSMGSCCLGHTSTGPIEPARIPWMSIGDRKVRSYSCHTHVAFTPRMQKAASMCVGWELCKSSGDLLQNRGILAPKEYLRTANARTDASKMVHVVLE